MSVLCFLQLNIHVQRNAQGYEHAILVAIPAHRTASPKTRHGASQRVCRGSINKDRRLSMFETLRTGTDNGGFAEENLSERIEQGIVKYRNNLNDV